MAEKSPAPPDPEEIPEEADKAPEVKDVEPEQHYRVAYWQFHRAADGVSVWHDEIHLASVFGDELEYLIEIGAIVPVE